MDLNIDLIAKKTKPIFERYPVDIAIIFGSYVKGTNREDSDIDIYIDTNGCLKGLDFVGLLEELTSTLKKDIDLFDSSHIEVESKIKDSIHAEGVIIYKKTP